jgi:hypothetical protein
MAAAAAPTVAAPTKNPRRDAGWGPVDGLSCMKKLQGWLADREKKSNWPDDI